MRPRHAAMADRHLLFVGVAGVCGALVLLVLIFAGARNRVKQANGAPEISADLLKNGTANRDPASRVVIGQNRKASGDPLQSLQTGRGELEFTNDEGLLAFRYRWDKSDPLETGWNRFTNPQAWIYRSETQLIRLSADEGMFRLAENRQPQAGVLQGHVVVSLYESKERRGAYSIDPDKTLPVAQFETDSLNFDAVRLSGRTDERVVARTPELIMIGKGMSLLFNERLGRIEELEINERELIAYRQPLVAAPTAESSEVTPPPTTAANSAPATPTPRGQAPAPQPTPTGSVWQEVTAYHLTLTKEVVITKGEGDDSLMIVGHDLAADFALRRSSFSGRLTGAPSSSLPEMRRSPVAAVRLPHGSDSSNRWAQLAFMPFGFTGPAVTFLGTDAAPGADDILITGEGGLVLVPIDGTPATLASPDDLFATLQGDPLRIDYGDFYAIGSELEYSRSEALAKLKCERDQPIEAGLPGGARLTSVVPFEYDFRTGEGTLMGAGTIVGLIPKEAQSQPPGVAPEASTSAMKGLPEGFSINWLNDFVVEFKGANQGGGLGKIAAAVFNGTVHVDDPNGYALDSQQLRIDFKDNANSKEQGIDTITATGDARLQSADGNVSGDELFVQFHENAKGSSYPGQMTVTGHGHVVNEGSSIAAQYIQANLVEQSMASEEALPAKFGGSSSFAVSDMLAQGAVVLTFEDGVMAMADRLQADARTDTAILTGENVIVGDPSLKVMGKHAEITNISSKNQDRVAKFIGAGTLTYFQPRPATPAADGATEECPVTTPEEMREELRRRLEGQPDSKPANDGAGSSDAPAQAAGSVRVEWADLLTFEEQQGRITFEGQVSAESEPTDREVDRLTGNWMQIELTEPIPTLTATGEAGKATRRLRKMTMLGSHDESAQVEAQRFTDGLKTTRELLLAVAGEIIEYTEATELFEAIGDGWMLVVDSSTPKPEAEPTDRAPSSAAVQFSGPGETEFTWTGRLSLRGGPGLLTISDDVIMRHRPTNEPVIRVDCDTMTASLKSSRSVGALDLSQSEGMDLTSAVADGSVFVRSEDRSIWADRLTYDRKTLLATIEALGDDYVVMEGEATGGAVQARRILWDFYTNGITVEGARIDGPMPTNNPGR